MRSEKMVGGAHPTAAAFSLWLCARCGRNRDSRPLRFCGEIRFPPCLGARGRATHASPVWRISFWPNILCGGRLCFHASDGPCESNQATMH